ncbi:hypothetical protein GDO86_017733 [Hymenochirus boettgeri]|uniref:Olfactory receptor n=1 Tax=Hymenochirus boettgeri TaxID=247094 RepID=A0A8T2IR75_9PIPI|nr:hypothetical protein GDO86_017733 [Hymenochirus boettgeri]
MDEMILLQNCSQNQPMLWEVFLTGFQIIYIYRVVLFTIFLFIYALILSGNIIIIVTIFLYKLLHSPMYFFLCNLSFSEMLIATSIIPKMLQQLIKNGVTMSMTECFSQFYFFGTFTLAECLFLTVMSYDRFLAICRPLHYHSIMHFWFCFYLSLACWIVASLVVCLSVSSLSGLYFCGQEHVIDHFFCDFGPILQLSCSDVSTVQMVVSLLSSASLFFPFSFIVMTYVSIIKSILKISLSTRKKKAFSTCSSHLIVVAIYYTTLILVYVLPTRDRSLQVNKILSLLYTVITPLLNPMIYSLRNREIKAALSLAFTGRSPHF